MTAQEFTERMRTLYGLVSGDLAKDALQKPAMGMFEAIRSRIVNSGKNSADSDIGNYSTKPFYATRNQFAKPGAFKAQGKNNKFGNTIGDRLIPSARLRSNSISRNPTKYKAYTLVKPNFKPRKSMYLAEGYKELRGVQGLRTDIMNLKYRGDLIADFTFAQEGQSFVIGFKSEEQAKKKRGLEKRFGSIFAPTQEELKAFSDAANYSLRRLTVGILGAEGITATVNVSSITDDE